MTIIVPPSLTRTQFAAVRAYIQRVPVQIIAERYFYEDEKSEAETQGVIQNIFHLIIQRTYQHNRADLADALLANFRHSEKGTIKALDAINEAELLGSPRPALSHSVKSWFSYSLATRLITADIFTIEDLFFHVKARGNAFWRQIPRVGKIAGSVIISWLRQHAPEIGIVVPNFELEVQLPLIRMTNVPHPIEQVYLSPDIDGSNGDNRRPQDLCKMNARNDVDAIRSFLRLRKTGTKTFLAYRKECERFLAWAVIDRRKAFSSITTDDCADYLVFLENPTPESVWCMGTNIARSLPGWRPFRGKLAISSIAFASRVLRKLFAYLVSKKYLASNPWLDVPTVKYPYEIQVKKALTQNAWESLITWLNFACENPDAAHLRAGRAALLLLRDTGVRRSEAVSVCWDDIEFFGNTKNDVVAGELKVIGKGLKIRRIPISARAVNAILSHYDDRKVDPIQDGSAPLLSPVAMLKTTRFKEKRERGDMRYSPSGLRSLIIHVGREFIAENASADPAEIRQIAKIRPHGLRHTFGTACGNADVPINITQEFLGHASVDTTTIYIHSDRDRKIKEFSKILG